MRLATTLVRPKEKTKQQRPLQSSPWWSDWRYTISILAAPCFFFPDRVPNMVGVEPAQYVQAVTFISGALLLLPFGIIVENVTDFFENMFRRKQTPRYDENAPSLFAGLIHASLTNISFLSLTLFTLINSVNQGQDAQTKAIEIVQLAIAGGLIVNLLFNLGFAVFVGGLGGKIFGWRTTKGTRNHSGRLRFSKELANQDVEMITIAIIVLGLPSLASSLSVTSGFFGESARKLVAADIPLISIVTSVLLLFIYVCYIGWTVLKFGDDDGSTVDSMMAQVQKKIYRAVHLVTGTRQLPFHEALNQQDQLKESIEHVVKDLDDDDRVAAEEQEHRDAEEAQQWRPLYSILSFVLTIPFLLLWGLLLDILQLLWGMLKLLAWGIWHLPGILWKLISLGGLGIVKLPTLIIQLIKGIGIMLHFLLTDRQFVGRFVLLLVGSVAVVLISSRMASSIEGGLVEGLGLNRFFVGLIVLPIASGLVDIIAATSKAWENDAQYSLAITAGSAVQVALFVAPVLVLLSQVFYGFLPDINLIFGFFILAVFALIVYYYQVMTVDGETTWFEGAQLLAIFFGVATVVFLAGQHGGSGVGR